MKKTSKGFTLVELLVVIGILGILMGALFPAISGAMLNANLSSCGMRGRKLFQSMIQCNTEREGQGLPTVWPKASTKKTDDPEDIAGNLFSTSTEYFKKLFDLDNYGSKDRKSYVDCDMDVLYGAGVPGITSGNLQPKNVAWVIASGLTDEMEDFLPVLCTRNVNYQQLKVDSFDGQATTEVKLGKTDGGESDTPFSNKAWVFISKGGGVSTVKAKYSKLNQIYRNQGFEIPAENEFKYLPVGL